MYEGHSEIKVTIFMKKQKSIYLNETHRILQEYIELFFNIATLVEFETFA